MEDNEASMTNASNTLDFAALDFDFDIPLSKPDTELHKPLVAEPALDDEEEHSFMPAPEVRTDAASVFDFDLSGIDLELPPATPADHGEPNFKQASSDDFKFDSDIPLTALDHADLEHESELMSEMTTKLDLAVAYQEIGDKDGARELLDEVLKGGNAEQISRAKTMLHELT